MPGGKAGKDHGKTKAKSVSRSARAGLQFPVGKFSFLSFDSFFHR
jgi:histone H2A